MEASEVLEGRVATAEAEGMAVAEAQTARVVKMETVVDRVEMAEPTVEGAAPVEDAAPVEGTVAAEKAAAAGTERSVCDLAAEAAATVTKCSVCDPTAEVMERCWCKSPHNVSHLDNKHQGLAQHHPTPRCQEKSGESIQERRLQYYQTRHFDTNDTHALDVRRSCSLLEYYTTKVC